MHHQHDLREFEVDTAAADLDGPAVVPDSMGAGSPGPGRARGPTTGSESPDLAIEGRDLFKIYQEARSEMVALRGADLEVRRGEFVSLTGPSGSGKTTLMSILAGLTTPSAGRIVVDGQDLSDLDEAGRAEWRARRVGVVFQRGNLIPFLSAEENVTLITRRRAGRRRARQRARELLAMMGLDTRARHRPNRLSGGEVQRVAIAVALANEPDVLFGDEVTGELDSGNSELVMATLLEAQRERGLTMLLVTHNPAIAALADRQLEISGGLVRTR